MRSAAWPSMRALPSMMRGVDAADDLRPEEVELREGRGVEGACGDSAGTECPQSAAQFAAARFVKVSAITRSAAYAPVATP